MKSRSITIAGTVIVTLLAVTVVGTALSQPHVGTNIPPPNPTIGYPKITQSCTGTGIAPLKIVGEKGWPNPPISTVKICVAAGDCTVTNTPCWPYSCDSGTKACKTSCSDKSDCGALGVCIAGQCQPPGSYCTTGAFQARLDGTMGPMGPYACNRETGVPYRDCQSGVDCAGKLNCNSSGNCVP
jgi:hypothetical protein